jgi:hypothetical protein
MTPTLADFETGTRVRYTGPHRGPGRARAAGTVLEAHSHPDQPGALRVHVLWDDQDDVHPYTVTPDTLPLWTLLPPPRIYAPDPHPGGDPMPHPTRTPTEALAAADAALANARATRAPNGGHVAAQLEALEVLAARLGDLGLALDALPPATDPDGEALDAWRMAAGWYVADAAAVVWDAWQRETHASRGAPDPVRSDVAALPLMTAEHALAVAHHALEPDDGELVPADETAAMLRARVTARNRNLS